jgi:hypothetical protein
MNGMKASAVPRAWAGAIAGAFALALAISLCGCEARKPRPSAAAGDVQVVLKNPAGIARRTWPVTFGVPLPHGNVAPAGAWVLADEAGRPLPAQIDIVNCWPADGSPRWLLVDLQADLTGAPEQAFTLRPARGAAPTAPQAIRVKAGGEELVVADGVRSFHINTNAYRILDRVVETASGAVRYAADTHAGAYLVGGSGTRYTAWAGRPDRIAVEEDGPLRAVVKAEGWHHAADGARRGRYVVRTHFYAGQPFVRVFHTFIVTDDSDAATFRDIGVRFAVEADRAAFGGAPGLQAVSPGQSAYLLQYDADVFVAVSNAAQPVRWGERTGGRAPGWASAFAGGRLAATLAVRDFWQQFPKELEVIGGQGIVFHAWPAHGLAKPDRVIEDAMLQYLWFCHEGANLSFKVPEAYWNYRGTHAEDEYRYLRGSKAANCLGLAKTHELLLAFGESAPPADQPMLALFQEPPAGMPAPAWMCGSGVFGRLHPYDPARFPEWERGLSRAFDCEQRLQEFTRDYGMFNFGGGHTQWDVARGRWDDVYRCWRAFHHGAPRVPWLLYVRSGDPKYLRQGVRNARHLLDVGVCHYSTPEWEQKPYPAGKIAGALNDYKGIVHWHAGNRLFDYNAMTDFMLYYYHLTGDRRGLDVATEWGEAAKARYREPIPNREGAGTTDAAIDMYLETGDRRYQEIAATNVGFFLDRVQNMGGGAAPHGRVATTESLPRGAFPQWENYAPWLQKYWETTGDARAGERLVAWGDAYLAGNGDACSRQERAYMNILAYAYFVSRDPRFLGHGKDEADRYIRSIREAPGSLYDGFPDWNQMSLGPGFMAQRIPYLMAALADYGKEPPSALLSAPPPQGFRLLYTVAGEPPASYVEARVHNPAGRPFRVSVVANAIVASLPLRLEVRAPDGSTAAETAVTLQGRQRFVLNVPAATGGVCTVRCAVSPPSSYWEVAGLTTEPALGTVFPLAGRTLNAMPCRYYFRVPSQASALTLAATGCESLYILDPAGQPISSTPFTSDHAATVTVPVPRGMGGKAWAFQGEFGKRSSVALSADGVPVPHVALSPAQWFDP